MLTWPSVCGRSRLRQACKRANQSGNDTAHRALRPKGDAQRIGPRGQPSYVSGTQLRPDVGGLHSTRLAGVGASGVGWRAACLAVELVGGRRSLTAYYAPHSGPGLAPGPFPRLTVGYPPPAPCRNACTVAKGVLSGCRIVLVAQARMPDQPSCGPGHASLRPMAGLLASASPYQCGQHSLAHPGGTWRPGPFQRYFWPTPGAVSGPGPSGRARPACGPAARAR